MEVASQPFMTTGHQDMDTMDIDIDMDVDVDLDEGPLMDEVELEEGEEPENALASASESIIPAIYTEDPSLELQPEKVHIRGVDDLHTNDILAFANDHFSLTEPSHIQWIDDTSANIIYASKDLALQAILSFVLHPSTAEAIHSAPLDLRPAKQLTSRPNSSLQVRIATVSDKKQRNAKDASRYYLLHPDQDPTERMRKEFESNGSRGRRGEHGDYQRRRFDDREHRRRRDKDHNGEEGNDFSASMYDDAPAANGDASARGRDLFSRVSGPLNSRKTGRRRSASPGRSVSTPNSDEIEFDLSDSDPESGARRRPARNGYRDRDPPPYSRRDPAPFPRNNAGKELFSDDIPKSRDGGGLRSDNIDLFPSTTSNVASTRKLDNSAAAKRLRADLQAATQTSPGRGSHRRSHAMDAKNAEDLSERFARKSLSMDSTKNGGIKELFPSDGSGGGGLTIRGSAEQQQGISIKGAGGFSIKGRAADVKELFPEQYSGSKVGNAGKELFDSPVRERRQRARADDWH